MKKLLWLTDDIQNSQSFIAQIGYTSLIYNVIDITQNSLYFSEMFSDDFCFIVHITDRNIDDFLYENICTLLEERSEYVQCIVITPIGNCFLPVKHRITETLQMCYIYDNTNVIGYSYLLNSHETLNQHDYIITDKNSFFQPIESRILSQLIDTYVNQECEHICVYAVSKESHPLQPKHNSLTSFFKKKKDSRLEKYLTPKRIESDMCETIIQGTVSNVKITTPLSTEVKLKSVQF